MRHSVWMSLTSIRSFLDRIFKNSYLQRFGSCHLNHTDMIIMHILIAYDDREIICSKKFLFHRTGPVDDKYPPLPPQAVY